VRNKVKVNSNQTPENNFELCSFVLSALSSAGGSRLLHKNHGSGRSMFFRGGGEAKVYTCYEMATKYPVAPASGAFTDS
jgi:hypothetical protein